LNERLAADPFIVTAIGVVVINLLAVAFAVAFAVVAWGRWLSRTYDRATTTAHVRPRTYDRARTTRSAESTGRPRLSDRSSSSAKR
jgi:hypothetical protein